MVNDEIECLPLLMDASLAVAKADTEHQRYIKHVKEAFVVDESIQDGAQTPQNPLSTGAWQSIRRHVCVAEGANSTQCGATCMMRVKMNR
jgi:hypothetical protein